MNDIQITEIDGFRLGSCEDSRAATGVTAVIAPDGAVAGCDVRGGGPATRETDLLRPENMMEKIHAVVLSGGSAYGLAAASGVMNLLEERGIGFDTGYGIVPIVCAASLFDLGIGTGGVRPDEAMGRRAAENAFEGVFRTGNHGAGCGCTVGKLYGMNQCMKSGQGASAIALGDLKIGAVTAVNALGDVFDENGKKLAGLRNADGTGFLSTQEELLKTAERTTGLFSGNTTITCILTNGILTKAQCTKLASIAHDGYARAIRPVHTSADGDTIFVMSTCEVEAGFDALAQAAAGQVRQAIVNGVKSAAPAYGFPAAGRQVF